MKTLFQTGDFLLHSGERTRWKIECEALTAADWETLAWLVLHAVPSFQAVEGVPRGGLALARLLKPFCDREGSVPVLIVDDVYTSGTSMEAQRAGRHARGVVVFARRPIVHPWVRAIFQFWDAGG